MCCYGRGGGRYKALFFCTALGLENHLQLTDSLTHSSRIFQLMKLLKTELFEEIKLLRIFLSILRNTIQCSLEHTLDRYTLYPHHYFCLFLGLSHQKDPGLHFFCIFLIIGWTYRYTVRMSTFGNYQCACTLWLSHHYEQVTNLLLLTDEP